MKIEAAAPRHAEIPLANETCAYCKVAAPDTQNWSQLAHRFCVRVREYTRTEPEQITPDQLTDEDWDRYHLVLFGSILDNPAILKLYQRSLCFTDAAYPGPRGVEIRTVLNPLARGNNVLLLGGSDYEQTHEAVIGLHRSFSQVTTERDGTLYLRHLNFCVSEQNQRAVPDEAETARLLETAEREPAMRLNRAVDALFYHYQTSREAWAEQARRLLEEEPSDPLSADDAWRLTLGWTLVHASPYFDDSFRLQMDRRLLRAGESAAAALETARPLTREACATAMAVLHVGAHLRRLYEHDPFQAHEGAIDRLFNVNDPGSRDSAVLDIWMSYLLRTENYDRLDEAPLREMARSVLAGVDNEKRHLAGDEAAGHSLNLLSKIAAFTNDGEPLWVRRWLEGGADSGNIAQTWTTSSYMPDRLPEEPRSIPRISPVSAGGRTARVALRRDLSPNGEYLSIGAEVQRLSWRGSAWLTSGAWTDEAAQNGGRLIRQADLNEVAYLELAFERWTRRVFWRFNRHILLADEWTGERRAAPLNCGWKPIEAGAELIKDGSEWRLQSGPSVLRICAAEGQTPDAWGSEEAVHAVLLTMEPGVHLERAGAGRFRAGREMCAFGAFNERGAEMNADAYCISEAGMSVFGFRELRVRGETQLQAETPVDFSLEWESGDGTLHVSAPTTMHWEDKARRLAQGEYNASFREFDWSAFRF